MLPSWSSRFELKPGTWVYVPTKDAVKLGREIKSALEKRWQPPENYFHLGNGGHVAALRSHLGKSSFCHLDVRRFFASINPSRIKRALKAYLPLEQAREWTLASTVPNPDREIGMSKHMLPYGFVQSPLLASICFFRSALGCRIRQLHGRDGVCISVYVDDIIISAEDEAKAAEVLALLKKAAEASAFQLNEAKEEGPAAKITAFNIELSQKSLLVEPGRLHAFVEAYSGATSEQVRRGIQGYIKSVDESQADLILAGA